MTDGCLLNTVFFVPKQRCARKRRIKWLDSIQIGNGQWVPVIKNPLNHLFSETSHFFGVFIAMQAYSTLIFYESVPKVGPIDSDLSKKGRTIFDYANNLIALRYSNTAYPTPSDPRLTDTSKKLRIPFGEQIKHPFCSRRNTISESSLPARSRSSF